MKMHVRITVDVEQQDVKKGCFNKMIFMLPKLDFFCCCTGCSLRAGSLWIGWTSLVLSIFFNLILLLAVMKVASPEHQMIPPLIPLPTHKTSTAGQPTSANTKTTTLTTQPTESIVSHPTETTASLSTQNGTAPIRDFLVITDTGDQMRCHCFNTDCSEYGNCTVLQADPADNAIYIRQNINLLNDTSLMIDFEAHPYYVAAIYSVLLLSFTFIMFMSILLLLGVHHHNIRLVKIWLGTNIITWIIVAVSHITVLTVFASLGIWNTMDTILSLFLMIISLQLYYYCIVLVKSYYEEKRTTHKSPYKKIEDQMKWETGCTMDHMIRKLPQIRFFCCCHSYTLRYGVLTTAWTGTAVLLGCTVWSTNQLTGAINNKKPLFREFRPYLFIDGNPHVERLAWVVITTEMASNWIFFYMWILLLIAVYSRYLKVLKIWLKMYIIWVILSLVFNTSCLIIAPIIHYPLFSNLLMTIFVMIWLFGVHFYAIVLIKSYYVKEWVTSLKNVNSQELWAKVDKKRSGWTENQDVSPARQGSESSPEKKGLPEKKRFPSMTPNNRASPGREKDRANVSPEKENPSLQKGKASPKWWKRTRQ